MNLRDRVILRMDQLGLRPYHVTQRMGAKSHNLIHSLVSGRTKTFRDIPRLASALETSAEWLITGGDERPHNGKRPYAAPDPRYVHILTLCMREWKKPAFKNLTEIEVLDIVRNIYDTVKTVRDKDVIIQADCLMAYQVNQGRG